MERYESALATSDDSSVEDDRGIYEPPVMVDLQDVESGPSGCFTGGSSKNCD